MGVTQSNTMKVMMLIAFLPFLVLAAREDASSDQSQGFGEEAFSALIQGDGKSEKRGTNPLSAILSSFAGEDTHATVHKNLKETHPDIFRQDGLELRGLDQAFYLPWRAGPFYPLP